MMPVAPPGQSGVGKTSPCRVNEGRIQGLDGPAQRADRRTPVFSHLRGGQVAFPRSRRRLRRRQRPERWGCRPPQWRRRRQRWR